MTIANFPNWTRMCVITYTNCNWSLQVLTKLFLFCAGNPRHKMHQTKLSGFKVFRPTTQDLLFKPRAGDYSRTATVSPRSKLQSRPISILSSTVSPSRLKASAEEHTRKLTFEKTVKSLTPTGALPKQGSKTSGRIEHMLPELFQQSPTVKDGTAPHLKPQPKLHLPAIVSS